MVRPFNHEQKDETIMLLTATPETPTAAPTFPALLEEAMRQSSSARSRRQYSLDHGIDETALIRYANGAVSTYERREIEGVLTKCDWARNYVVDLVKNRRVKRDAA
jgi:hypothetical protein